MKPDVLKEVIKKSGEPFPRFLEHQILSWGHLVPNGETISGDDLALLIWSSQMKEVAKKDFNKVPWLSRVVISYYMFLYLGDKVSITRTKKAGISYATKNPEAQGGGTDPELG